MKKFRKKAKPDFKLHREWEIPPSLLDEMELEATGQVAILLRCRKCDAVFAVPLPESGVIDKKDLACMNCLATEARTPVWSTMLSAN
jgi:hypothetical protein